ncbi:hypothetical protein MMC10_004968 [Thelotrema lepadinum]|nr:hypothetical protein [Thelotrema lepadinum]
MAETRLLARSWTLLGRGAAKPSKPCCSVWYQYIRPRAAPPNTTTGSDTRWAHTTKQKAVKANVRKQEAPIVTETPQSRAFSRLNDLLQDALQILSSPQPPAEAAVLESLSTCKDLAKYFKDAQESPNLSNLKTNSAAANLLFLDSHNKQQPYPRPSTPLESQPTSEATIPPSAPSPYIASSIANEAKATISTAAWDLIRDAKVFITPDILKSYVEIQSLLSHPESLAEVFSLYASKPIPQPSKGSEPIKFYPSNPNKISTAIPFDTASTALSAAIRAEKLTLALDIIDRTVCTPSFRRAKLVRRALVPGIALASVPVGAYSLASQFSAVQEALSSANATGIAFAGILTYFSATATIGVVAMTTANDHMERVTWANGTPLRERWLREEERQMYDLVAAAWGFKEGWKRGEEEGEDWMALRELIGMRRMMLDRVELMEGME